MLKPIMYDSNDTDLRLVNETQIVSARREILAGPGGGEIYRTTLFLTDGAFLICKGSTNPNNWYCQTY